MIVIIIVAVAAWLFSGSKNEEQIDFKQEAVTTQTLQNSVTATGTIEAVTSVTVGTQVSGAMIVIIIVAVAAWLFSGSKNEEQIDFKQEAVTTQTLQNSVTATGTIEAVTSVTVGTQVSGIVNKLYVDYNSQVKKVKS